MTKTSIVVNQGKRLVNMTVAGQMTMEDAQKFINEYKSKIGPLNGPDYVLEVDCTEMKILTPEMSEDLLGVMKMYKETGFNKIKYTIKNNQILKMQLSRISRNAGLAQSEVVEI